MHTHTAPRTLLFACMLATLPPVLAKSDTNSAFYSNFFERFKTTGAIAPSSRFLAREIISDVERYATAGKPLNILEVGPGDGAFTKPLVEMLRDKGIQARIYAAEIDDTFVEALKQDFAEQPHVVICKADIIQAHDATTFGLPKDFQFDVIISGLPFYADFFTAEQTATIFNNYNRLLKKGGILRWFSYIAAPTFAEMHRSCRHVTELVPTLLSTNPKSRTKQRAQRKAFKRQCADFASKCAFIENFKQTYAVTSSGVIANLPLARVHQYQKP